MLMFPGLQKRFFRDRFSSSISGLVETGNKFTRKVKEFFTSGTQYVWCVVNFIHCEFRKYNLSGPFLNQSVGLLFFVLLD